MTTGKYRLLTRSDFDGFVSAVLLKEMDLIDDVSFVHPKDVQDGKVEVTDRHILTNLPYAPACHLCFDHHVSEEIRHDLHQAENHVLDTHADSAARVVYDYYGGAETFKHVNTEMLDAVDKADSARFSLEEILNPSGWVLLSFIMDPRTGLGRFRDFNVSNYEMMMQLISFCRDHTIQEILQLPDVCERIELYNVHGKQMIDQIKRCSTVHGDLVVLDLRNEETIYCGNRFLIYAVFPQCRVSIHLIWGLKKQNTVFAIGKSILDRTSPIDIGDLALLYGGGGHLAAGACQVPNEDADSILEELIARITVENASNAHEDAPPMPHAA
ncbi:MAG: exopolyphosphatase [Planctomycetota bacterium]|nr:exopolyphosphatase [Planctomycetota bacterium]